MQNETAITWTETAALSVRVANAIRKGISKTCQHQKYTRRVHDAITKELRVEFQLPDVGPGSGCFFFGDHEIRVWGFPGLTYNNPVYLIWNWPSRWSSAEKQTEHWSAPILAECSRVDMTDYLERHAAEEAIMPQLLRLEDSIASAIFAARAEARRLIDALPHPNSATLRTHFYGLCPPHEKALPFILGGE